MYGFEYNYMTWEEITSLMKLIVEFNVYEIAILSSALVLIILLILYVFPYFRIFLDYRKNIRTKENRKNLIKQIALQKDIDDEIEHELNIHDSV